MSKSIAVAQNSDQESKNIQLEHEIKVFYDTHVGDKGAKFKIYEKLNRINPGRFLDKTNAIEQHLQNITALILEGADCNLECEVSGSKKVKPIDIAAFTSHDTLTELLISREDFKGLQLYTDPIVAKKYTKLARDSLHKMDDDISNIESQRELSSNPALKKEKKDLSHLRERSAAKALTVTARLMLPIVQKSLSEKDPAILNQYLENLSIMKSFLSDLVDRNVTITEEDRKGQSALEFYAPLLYIVNNISDQDFKSKVETRLIPKSVRNTYYRNGNSNISKRVSTLEMTDTDYQKSIDEISNLYSAINIEAQAKSDPEENATILYTDSEDSFFDGETTTEAISDTDSLSTDEISSSMHEEASFSNAEKTQQIRNFLNRRSKADLPKFIQPLLKELIEQYPGSYFAIKGSGSRYRKESDVREANDLDLEIVIPKISEWSEEKRQNLVNKFIPQVKEQHFINSKSLFSLSVKDEILPLDLSIYDASKMPSQNKSWSTSEDTRLVFMPPDYKGEFVRPIKTTRPNRPFFINPEARDIIFRASFAATTNPHHVTPTRLSHSLRDLLPNNPMDYLYHDFQVYRMRKWDESRAITTESDYLRDKINDFSDKHNFNHQLRADFTKNLSFILHHYNAQKTPPQEIAEFSRLYKTIDFMLAELPPTTIIPATHSSLGTDYYQKLSESSLRVL